MRKGSFVCVLAMGAVFPAEGQFIGGQPDPPMNSGWNGCGSDVEIEFTEALIAPLTYEFQPQIDPGSLQWYETRWLLIENDLWTVVTGVGPLMETFPAPGEELVCLALTGSYGTGECATVTCRTIDILQDSSCADLVVDFTIAEVNGTTITFQDLSSFDGADLSHQWSFADEVGIASSAQFTFEGNGPHEVCLTVFGPPPISCTRTICKWLYMGPAPVPCVNLADPGFKWVMVDRLVALMDTTTTAGMDRTVLWDHGDGSPVDTGLVVVHEYMSPGEYEVCGTVHFAGPLTDGDCFVSTCQWVTVGGLYTVVDPHNGANRPGVHPVPFRTGFEVTGLMAGVVHWTILDMAGSTLCAGGMEGEAMRVDTPPLAPGAYLLRLKQDEAVWNVRLVKE